MARVSEFTVLGQAELEGRLVETRRELFNLRFQLATGQLDNSARLTHARRDVARILTILRQREIAVAEGHEVAAPAQAAGGAGPDDEVAPEGAEDEEDA